MSPERRRPRLEARTRIRWPEESATRIVTDHLYNAAAITVVGEEFSVHEHGFAYAPIEQVRFITAAKPGIYGAEALGERLQTLIPPELEPATSVMPAGSIEDRLSIGKLTFTDFLGAMETTTTTEVTVYDAAAFKRSGIATENPAAYTVTKQYFRDVNVRLYPNEDIAEYVHAYERGIDTFAKKGIALVDVYLEGLRTGVSLESVAGITEQVELHGGIKNYLTAVSKGETPFDKQADYALRDHIMARVRSGSLPLREYDKILDRFGYFRDPETVRSFISATSTTKQTA